MSGLHISPHDASRGLWTLRQLVVAALLAVIAAACMAGLLWFTAAPALQFIAWAGDVVLRFAVWCVVVAMVAMGVL